MQPPPLEIDDERPKSFWRELADGSAGPVVRLLVTLALAAILAAMCMFGAYVLALLVPAWRYNYGSGSGVYPRDELGAWLAVLAALFYLPAVYWIWTRNTKHKGIWFASIMTVVIGAVAIALGVLVDESMHGGSEELIIGGIILTALASVLMVWLFTWRTFSRGRARRNPEDGLLDVRCPSCGYRMVGLQEAKCPECGAAFTLEELLSRQNFRKT